PTQVFCGKRCPHSSACQACFGAPPSPPAGLSGCAAAGAAHSSAVRNRLLFISSRFTGGPPVSVKELRVSPLYRAAASHGAVETGLLGFAAGSSAARRSTARRPLRAAPSEWAL